MSRSKKGSKGAGFDYWGKRGMKDKETTKGIEPTRRRAEIVRLKKGEEKPAE